MVAHVQALAPAARSLLEVVAVAGRPLDKQLALDASGASHEQIDALLAEHLVRASGGGQERCIECYHDKIRESVTQGLAAEPLRSVHARLLAVLREQQDADAEHLAVHAEGAGDRAAAAHYAAEAAAAAGASMAFEQAAMLYARALELGEHGDDARRELQTKLGDALANAGRGADAARAYLEGAIGADEELKLELKRRAAEQLLACGHFDDGKMLLQEVLRSVGLGLPTTQRAALLSLAWQRTRLRLRGLGFRKREDALPATQLLLLNTLWSAARGLQPLGMLTGAALASRYVRLALGSGVPEHAVRALCTEAWFASAATGAAAAPRADALLDRAEAQALASGGQDAFARVQLYRGLATFMQGKFETCNLHLDPAIQTLREQCRGVAFELGQAICLSQLAATVTGGFMPATELAGLIEDRWGRGDLSSAVLFTGMTAAARLVQGDVDGVRRHIEQARQRWHAPRERTWIEQNLFLGEVAQAQYTGSPEWALDRLQAEWPAMQRALLLRHPATQAYMRSARGGAALGVARRGGAGANALRDVARSDARAVLRLGMLPWTEFSNLIRAGLCCEEGNIEQASILLRSAVTGCDLARMPTYAAAMRRRLGQLLDGDEGAALVAQADAALRVMGAVDLEATTRLFTWGIEFR